MGVFGVLITFIEALESRLGTLSLDKQQKLEKDMAKAEAKAEAKADAALKKKMASQVRRPCPSCIVNAHVFTGFPHS
jgi:hypothetical protein